MAYIITGQRRGYMVSDAEGLHILKVLHNLEEPANDIEARRLEDIKKVTFNYRLASTEYVLKHLPLIAWSILNDWYVDRKGQPTKPANQVAWAFAKKHGLYVDGIIHPSLIQASRPVWRVPDYANPTH